MDKRLGVVVVEDEPIILRYVARKISELDPDVQVLRAESGAQAALDFMRQHAPDILFTDIEMPGMNGLELIEAAQHLHPGLQVIILSGYSNFEYAQTALRYGVFDYLLKPVDPADIEAALRRVKAIVLERRELEAVKDLRRVGSNAAGFATLGPGEQSEVTVQIERYIATHFNCTITVGDIATHFSYSTTYINRLFKRKYAMTPIQYQIGLRIEKAKELLRSFPETDIKNIAAAVGYADARYFSRVFRQMVGVAPSEYLIARKG